MDSCKFTSEERNVLYCFLRIKGQINSIEHKNAVEGNKVSGSRGFPGATLRSLLWFGNPSLFLRSQRFAGVLCASGTLEHLDSVFLKKNPHNISESIHSALLTSEPHTLRVNISVTVMPPGMKQQPLITVPDIDPEL